MRSKEFQSVGLVHLFWCGVALVGLSACTTSSYQEATRFPANQQGFEEARRQVLLADAGSDPQIVLRVVRDRVAGPTTDTLLLRRFPPLNLEPDVYAARRDQLCRRLGRGPGCDVDEDILGVYLIPDRNDPAIQSLAPNREGVEVARAARPAVGRVLVDQSHRHQTTAPPRYRFRWAYTTYANAYANDEIACFGGSRMQCAHVSDIGRIAVSPEAFGDTQGVVFLPPHTNLEERIRTVFELASEHDLWIWYELKTLHRIAEFEDFTLVELDSVNASELCGRFSRPQGPMPATRFCLSFSDLAAIDVLSSRERIGLDGGAIFMPGG